MVMLLKVCLNIFSGLLFIVGPKVSFFFFFKGHSLVPTGSRANKAFVMERNPR